MAEAGRRQFLLAAGSLVAASVVAAQVPGRKLQIGVLLEGERTAYDQYRDRFEGRLRELGYVEGVNLIIDIRMAQLSRERLGALAAELADSRPDVIVVLSTTATRAAMRATRSIPIVMIGTADPVGTGLVASLARPGGNVTGQSMAMNELSAKWVEMLLELAPGARKLGYLGQSSNAGMQSVLAAMERTAAQHGATMRMLDVVSSAEVDAAFETMARENYGGFVVAASAVLVPNVRQIVERAAVLRVPAVYTRIEYVVAGGLISYHPDRDVYYRRAADFVDRIARGSKPADMPVEQVSTFVITVNLRAARAMGITIPRSILLRADRVIQ